MRLKDYISLNGAYEKAEEEIRAWVETRYPGLSIVFDYPAPEIVQIDSQRRFARSRVQRIIEAVNIKIGEVLEEHEEEIYIADILDRIYKRHPDFDIEVESLEDVKRNQQFLEYMKELRIRSA